MTITQNTPCSDYDATWNNKIVKGMHRHCFLRWTNKQDMLDVLRVTPNPCIHYGNRKVWKPRLGTKSNPRDRVWFFVNDESPPFIDTRRDREDAREWRILCYDWDFMDQGHTVPVRDQNDPQHTDPEEKAISIQRAEDERLRKQALALTDTKGTVAVHD